MDIFCISDSPDFLEKLKFDDFKIIALDFNKEFYEENIDLDFLEVNEEENLVVVVGNEGRGIDEEIRKVCDKAVFVRGCERIEEFPGSLVDSLNVSVAASLVMNKIRRK